MGLFDFLDLNGDTGAWDMAGTVSKDARAGYNAGVDQNQKVMMDQANTGLALRKMDLADLEFQEKLKDGPMNDALKRQKINLPTPEPKQEDYDEAKKRIFGDTVPDAITPEQESAMHATALEVAKEKVPDPVKDPDNWMNYVNKNAKSDWDLDIEKAKLAAERDRVKQEAMATRQATMLKQALGIVNTKLGQQQSQFVATQKGINKRHSDIMDQENTARALKEQEKRRSEALGIVKEMRDLSEYTPHYADQLKAKRDKLEAHSIKYKTTDVLSGADDEFGPKFGRLGIPIQGVSTGGARLYKPDQAPAGERQKLPNGALVEKRNGKWYGVHQ